SQSGCQSGHSRLSATEAALEAWVQCDPVGYALPAHRAYALLFTLGAHLPGCSTGLSGRARKLEQLLLPVAGGSECPGLAPVLKVDEGQVHFLSFWQAFSGILRNISVGDDLAPQLVSSDDDPVAEVELVRDEMLIALEARPDKALDALTIVDAVARVGGMSSMPQFWEAVSQSACFQQPERLFDFAQLTVLLLTWLHDAIMWKEEPAANLSASMQQPRHPTFSRL
ncbi:unnamed protein product, partial [Polarella glacialis]